MTQLCLHIIVSQGDLLNCTCKMLLKQRSQLSGNKNFILTTTPPGPRKQWFPFALTDPALFHATLLIAASHIAGSKRSRPSSAYFQHRGEVIQIVSDRISNGFEAASDGTVGAISMLLVTDVNLPHPSLSSVDRNVNTLCIEHVRPP